MNTNTMNPSLVILAAGIGSRYGGLKQIDKLGPNGETILDYSIKYAISVGFKKIVFVIRKNIEAQLRETFLDKYSAQADIHCVFQELDSLPFGITPGLNRTKPWGTGHAVLMAKDIVHEPFIAIGCDDFYGREAFVKSYDFLKTVQVGDASGCLVGYYLKNTLSEHGYVSRGICQVGENDYLLHLADRLKIKNVNGVVQSFEDDANPVVFPENTIASMSFYGFTPRFLELLEEKFIPFITEYSNDPKKEFYITDAMGDLIGEGKLKIKVFRSSSQWFGITNPEDKPVVMKALRSLETWN